MASYSLTQKGVAAITSATPASPLDVALASAVKTGSAIVHATVKDRRRNTFIQRGTISMTSADAGPTKDSSALATAVDLTASQVFATIRDRRQNSNVQRGTVLLGDGGTSPNDVTITAVDLSCAECSIKVRENRDGNPRGVTAKLTSTTNLRLQFYGTVDVGENIEIDWEVVEHKPRREATVLISDSTHVRATWDGTLAAGETIDIDFEVVESKPQRGATVRLLNATTVRVEWDGGVLVAGETIDVSYEVWDIDDIGDDIKLILFRLLLLLRQNILQDNILYDDAGNLVSYRVRIFDTKVNVEDATPDIPSGEGMETGEMSRVTITQDVNMSKNDREALMSVLTDIIATPGAD